MRSTHESVRPEPIATHTHNRHPDAYIEVDRPDTPRSSAAPSNERGAVTNRLNLRTDRKLLRGVENPAPNTRPWHTQEENRSSATEREKWMAKLIMLNYEPLKKKKKVEGKKKKKKKSERPERNEKPARETFRTFGSWFATILCVWMPNLRFVLRHHFLHVISLCTLHVSPHNTTTVIYICISGISGRKLGNGSRLRNVILTWILKAKQYSYYFLSFFLFCSFLLLLLYSLISMYFSFFFLLFSLSDRLSMTSPTVLHVFTTAAYM